MVCSGYIRSVCDEFEPFSSIEGVDRCLVIRDAKGMSPLIDSIGSILSLLTVWSVPFSRTSNLATRSRNTHMMENMKGAFHPKRAYRAPLIGEAYDQSAIGLHVII
jgi:hypothetical protein